MNNQKSSDITQQMACSSPVKNEEPFHILVPIASATKDVQVFKHAAHVAATQNGLIHLFYITDLMQLPEFENPFIIRRWIRQVRKEASNRLKSFRSLIEKLGAKVLSSESSEGNTSFVLQEKVQRLIPDLIIVGQGSLNGRTLEKLTKKSPCPVVIVPGSMHRSVLYVGIQKKRIIIDSLELLHSFLSEKWSFN